MTIANQGACQSRKTAENDTKIAGAVDFPNQELARIPKL
jgi:hypothetical protein